MAKSIYVRIFLACELTIAALLGVRAYAQAPAPPPAPTGQGGQLQQITVTGYLIPRVGRVLSQLSPMTRTLSRSRPIKPLAILYVRCRIVMLR
jgi:hypothetical protein